MPRRDQSSIVRGLFRHYHHHDFGANKSSRRSPVSDSKSHRRRLRVGYLRPSCTAPAAERGLGLATSEVRCAQALGMVPSLFSRLC